MAYRCMNWRCDDAADKVLHCDGGECAECGEPLYVDAAYHGLCCDDPECWGP
jgi:hypothetical protein